jgi:hypothetical protein
VWTKLLRTWWKILARFGKPEPVKFDLCYVAPGTSSLTIREALKPICYQENYWQIWRKGQGIGLRKLVGEDKQVHLRYYPKTGRLTGHREYDFFVAEDKHMKGESVRPIAHTQDGIKVQVALGKLQIRYIHGGSDE